MVSKYGMLLERTLAELPPLFKLRGVVGFSRDVQMKVVRNMQTREPCIRVYVDKKRPKWLCRILRCLIPEEILGLKTDVWPIGRQEFQKDIHQERHDPLLGGISFCHFKLTAATGGIVLLDNDTEKPKYVSNTHVIYNVDNPGGDCSKVGDPQLQPGPTDGGLDPQDQVANGERYIQLEGSYPGGIADAACAVLQGKRFVKVAEILHLGKIKGTREPEVGMTLRGCCRNGDFTVQVYDRAAMVQVHGLGCTGRNQYCYLRTQVLYSPGLGPGSSGTCMVSEDGRAVVINSFGRGSAGQGNGGGGWFENIMEPLNLKFPGEEPPPPPPEGEFEYSLDEGQTWQKAKAMRIRGVKGETPEARIKVSIDDKPAGEGKKVQAEISGSSG